MTPPENDLRDAVARAEGNGRLLPRQIENGCTWENSSPLWQTRMRQEADRLLASSGGKVLVARILAAEADLAKARADLERVTAENADWRHQWEEMAELVCEFAAEKAPDAIALVGADRDGWRKRALVAAEAMTRLAERADTAEAENTRLRALLVDAGEALRPLAAGADTADADAEAIFYPPARYPDDTTIDPILPSGEMPKLCELGDLRRARTTIAALDKAQTPKEPA